MLRKVVGPIACCLFLTWGVPAAPRKDDRAPSYYFATKVGDKLVYEEKRGSQSEEYLIEVIEARQKGAAMIVTV
jgi:hypothetical protein